MKIVCNNVPRNLIYGFELSEKERAAGYLRNMGWSVEGAVAVLAVRKGI